jgi:signal transduction histidine kinase/CheY-like chemotaxis protein
MARQTILLVEDNAITRKMLRVALEAEDYAVSEAEDGLTALACIQERRPDLIIQDIILPDLDGLELTSRIRALPHGVDVPIMVLSGFVGRIEMARAVTDRYVAFLVKPVTPSRLVEAVHEHLPRSPTEERGLGVPAASVEALVLPDDERAQRDLQQGNQAARLILLDERCTRQAAELSLLGGIADALTRGSDADMELTLRDIFAATLDAAGISTGALYLVLNGAPEVSLRQSLGFSASARVGDFFGHFSVLQDILADKVPVTLPSAAIPESSARAILAQAEMASIQVVPLIFDCQAVGALLLGSRAVDLPSEGVVAFARAIGAQIVQSLAFIRAFDQRKAAEASLRQANVELEDKVVARTRELSNANAALQRTARMRQDMIAIVSHDLRNPLSTISLAVAQMTRSAGASVPERTIARVGRAAAQMEQLIGGLLDCASIEEGSFSVTREPVSIRGLLAEVVEAHTPLAEAKSLRLEGVGPLEDGLLSGDSGRLSQVFSNLIGNAIKFTRAGGVIRLSATQAQECWQISVADSGCGIDPEHVPHIFDRYWQGAGTGRHGIGLGLAIAKGIVEIHGGRLWVESQVGVGSTFRFTLPVWTAPAEVADAAARKVPASGTFEVTPSPRTVLVVDDDEDLRELVAALLVEAGYQVLQASDGQAALAVLASASVHLILLDQQMRGMNGAAFLRERQQRADLIQIPVLMVSGSRIDLAPGVAELIRKPFTRAALLDAVRRRCAQGELSSVPVVAA